MISIMQRDPPRLTYNVESALELRIQYRMLREGMPIHGRAYSSELTLFRGSRCDLEVHPGTFKRCIDKE